MPVGVSSAVTSGSSEVSRGEEKDSACDVALTSDPIHTDLMRALADGSLPSCQQTPAVVAHLLFALPVTVFPLKRGGNLLVCWGHLTVLSQSYELIVGSGALKMDLLTGPICSFPQPQVPLHLRSAALQCRFWILFCCCGWEGESNGTYATRLQRCKGVSLFETDESRCETDWWRDGHLLCVEVFFFCMLHCL